MREDQSIMKNRFLFFRNSLSDIFVGGYSSFYIAKLIKPSYLKGYRTFRESPMYWYFSYRAHSEAAISILARIYEKRPSGREDQLTLHKFLYFMEQNLSEIFDESVYESVRMRVKEDQIRLYKEDEIIGRLNNIRDKVLGHFDISVLIDPEKQFHRENEISDDELERLYKISEDILTFYGVSFNGESIINSRILADNLESNFSLFLV